MRAVTLFFIGLAAYVSADDYKVVCYFGSWSSTRHGNGKFSISDIDASLCTHLIYAFVGVTTEGNVEVLHPRGDVADAGGQTDFGKFNALRRANPNVKTMIAMGGWNEGSTKYSQIVSNPQKRKMFVKNVLEFIKKHGFDGFDLDWEYPNQRGGQPIDKENFVSLLEELKMKFREKGLILSAAVAAAETSASQSYLIRKVAKHLDFINVMTYDLHGQWESVTGIHAPLYAGSWEQGQARGLNIDACVNYWIRQGASPEQLVLGVPFYGRSFKLANPSMNGVGAPAIPGPAPGKYTQEGGFLGYNEICENLKDGSWKRVLQEEQRVPYAYHGDQWVGYDDKSSLEEKAKYVKKRKLGGMMVWSIETDDFRGNCGEKYPLLNTLNRVLHDHSIPSTTSEFTDIKNTHHWQKSQKGGKGELPQVPNINRQGLLAQPPSWNSQHPISALQVSPMAPGGPRTNNQMVSSFQNSAQNPQRNLWNNLPPAQSQIQPGSSQLTSKLPDGDQDEDHFEDSDEYVGPNDPHIEANGADEHGPMPNPLVPTQAPQKMTSDPQGQKIPPNSHTPSSVITDWGFGGLGSKPVQNPFQVGIGENGASPGRLAENSQNSLVRESVYWPATQTHPLNPQNQRTPPQTPPQTPQMPFLVPSMPSHSPGAGMQIPQHHLHSPHGFPSHPLGPPQSIQGPPVIIYGPPVGSQGVFHHPWQGQPGFGQDPRFLPTSPQVVGNSPMNFAQSSPITSPSLQGSSQHLPIPLPNSHLEVPKSGAASDPLDKRGLCTRVGLVGDPDRCDIFYSCKLVDDKYHIHKFDCPPATKFNPSINTCDHAEKVQC